MQIFDVVTPSQEKLFFFFKTSRQMQYLRAVNMDSISTHMTQLELSYFPYHNFVKVWSQT